MGLENKAQITGHQDGGPTQRGAHANPNNVGLLPHELGEVCCARSAARARIAASWPCSQLTLTGLRPVQLARIASGLHAASFLSCMVVPYLYLTTNKRRRARTAKLLFFLSLCGAVLALITGLQEWSTAAAVSDGPAFAALWCSRWQGEWRAGTARTHMPHAATLDKDMHTHIHTRTRSACARAFAGASPRA
jgi:hypothetical protein